MSNSGRLGAVSEAEIPADWRSFPPLPLVKELISPERINVLENPVDTVPNSKEEYLETHYRLYRCEGLEPLRITIAEYKAKPAMMESVNTCIYTQVYIQGYLLSRVGPVCRVAFSTERSPTKVVWRQSSRLAAGTLVILSPKSDNFRKKFFVATVASRHIVGGLEPDPEAGEDDNTPPRIDLAWADYKTAPVDPTVEMVMLEAKNGFFENVRHAMVGLQHAALSTSVLDKYVLGQSRETTMADYVHHLEDQKCQVPSAAAHFDASQMEAFKAMTSQEFCIVQGPPGTGKTFTSLVAIQSYVDSLWNRKNSKVIPTPIIVAAQTNHALDQILDHCMQREIGDIARLGSQSKSDAINERTLFNIREQSKCRGRDGNVEARFKKVCHDLHRALKLCFRDGLITANDFLAADEINEEQHKSLTDNDWESADSGSTDDPISTWLGNFVQDEPVHVYRPPEGQEEPEKHDKDPQKVFEPEEDDRYRLHGEYIPFKLTRGAAVSQQTLSGASWRDHAKKLVKSHQDLYKISPQNRGIIYHYMRSRMMESATIRNLFMEYIQACAALRVSRWNNDAKMLQQERIQIIGCTTTGLTKYRGLIAALQPRIMLIEEAAETREANITSALFPSLEQLILVGDHQQLTPHVDTRCLEGPPYNLKVSLFERMVKLNVPFSTLRVQRRMIPAIRQVVQTFYPMLEDHEIVTDPEQRPPVPGMGGKNLWWFQHAWPEERDGSFSCLNRNEAEMIIGFVKYLVQNGLAPNQITILTYYNAQLDFIYDKLKTHPFLGQMTKQWAVRTVDGFQGEESDIILLSLVRSPARPTGRAAVGFVASENRAVVATSRARCGFYIFGNAHILLNDSAASRQTWQKVVDAFGENTNFYLPVTCAIHGDVTNMRNPDSWQGISGGGCARPCDKKCSEGHPCKETCHAYGQDHKSTCEEACQKMLSCGHGCSRKCKDKCACSNGCFTPKAPEGATSINRKLPMRNRGRRTPTTVSTPKSKSRASSRRSKPALPQAPIFGSQNLIDMGYRRFVSMEEEREEVRNADKNGDNSIQNEGETRDTQSSESSMSPQCIREVYCPTTTDAKGNRVVGMSTVREHVSVKNWAEENSGDLIQFD